MKRVVVLGSTGSIGRQALDVISSRPEEFSLLAICANTSVEQLYAQAEKYKPSYAGLTDAPKDIDIARWPRGVEPMLCADAADILAALPEADIIVHGISGLAGTRPLLSALKAGKTVALANKESIVCAHGLVNEAIERFGGKILPVDSEQSAIFQCLSAGKHDEVARLILTASGGPFFKLDKERLKGVTVSDALKHPTWSMGRKITIDSATLFNKGLEIIEAAYLFDIPGERIEAVIHPQSIVHSMVEYEDGATIAQMSPPDMRLAIQYALTWPERHVGRTERLDFNKLYTLEFYPPDTDKFPALGLAYEALKKGGAYTVAYNGANEAAVEMFVQGRIGFLDIPRRVEYAMAHIGGGEIRCYEDVIEADGCARRLAGK